jgi:hypothetical protein
LGREFLHKSGTDRIDFALPIDGRSRRRCSRPLLPQAGFLCAPAH